MLVVSYPPVILADFQIDKELNLPLVDSKWYLARQSMRICVQNGFHKRAIAPNPEVEQLRRRVF